VLRVGPTGRRPGCHADQPQYPHEPLHPLAVDCMTLFRKRNDHAPSAIKRPACILCVDQPQQLQVQLVQDFLATRRIHPGARHPRQLALPAYRQWLLQRLALDPLPPHAHRLSPDFFFSQSSSTFSRPISL